jgi:arylsulfatase
MAAPMNAVFVVSDQHQAQCTGYEGHAHAITPNMDRLAADGVRFRHAYTQSPICTPSRLSFLSGQYSHNHGYYGLSGPTPFHLPSFLLHFRRNGYRTGAIGNLHLPNVPRNWLVDHVDYWNDCYSKSDGTEGPGVPYYDYLKERGLAELEDSLRLPEFPGFAQHDARPSSLAYEHCVEAWCLRDAIRFIDSCGDAPFCVHVSLPRPHQCYTPSERFWDLYPSDIDLPPLIGTDVSLRPPHFQQEVERLKQRSWLIEPRTFEAGVRRVWRGYLACITQVDFALGELMDHLDRRGLAGNTALVYGTDHGAYSGTFGVREKAPGICSELVCRVPMIWRAPRVTAAGTVNRQLVENIDIGPTLASLCGLPEMDWVDGKDLTPLLRGEDRPLRKVAATEHVWSKSVRWDKWRLVHYQPAMFGGRDIGELYDIETDPLETRNLYYDSAFQTKVEQGRRLLLEWLIETTRPVTIWPDYAEEPSVQAALRGGDAKESNSAGAELRRERGNLNYL